MPENDQLNMCLSFVNELNRQLASLKLAYAKGEIDDETFVLLSNSSYKATRESLTSTSYFSSSVVRISESMMNKMMGEQVSFSRELNSLSERSK